MVHVRSPISADSNLDSLLTDSQFVVPIFGRNPPPPDANDAPPPYALVESHEANAAPERGAPVKIQPLCDKEGVIITVQPPRVPENETLSHVPCDIALVIDVSGSMGVDAPAPGEDERTGLSVLDLVKHACHTIMSTMTKKDRLAIVTFSNGSRVLQPLTDMTDANKEEAKKKIEAMGLESCTNLWHGLRDGIKLFTDQASTGRVPAVMVLTDGVPNHMCPPQGYVPALKAMGNIVPSVHTFGFGYTLRSGLLKSIAEFGGGNYAFIPDAGMIGTVFVHAVANLQSTFANTATLKLTYPDNVTIQQMTGIAVGQEHPVQAPGGNFELNISLGSLQYGQSRDIYLKWRSSSTDSDLEPSFLNVALTYTKMTEVQHSSHASRDLMDLSFTSLSDAEIASHTSRARICAFLSELFPIDGLGEHRLNPKLKSSAGLAEKQRQLESLIATLPAADFPDDPLCAALMLDLAGEEPSGQVSLALSKDKYLTRWGQHYLPSLHGAHVRQACNSFKDPGPLQYGTDSPLFIKCRDVLSTAFDELPAPEPSNISIPEEAARHTLARSMPIPPGGFDSTSTCTLSMRSYNSSSAPCFAGRTRVRLANNRRVRISSLRRGSRVATPAGPRKVVAVLVTPVSKQLMVEIEGVLVTHWHPITLPTVSPSTRAHDARGWVYPAQVTPQTLVRYTGWIYSVLLETGKDINAHAIELSGGSSDDTVSFWGVTLGHGMVETTEGNDVRAHPFFGSYKKVAWSLGALQKRRDGLVFGGGVKRSKSTGLVVGFKPYWTPNLVVVNLMFSAHAALLRRRRMAWQEWKREAH
jgi:Mg-chelatase subunit ChlD